MKTDDEKKRIILAKIRAAIAKKKANVSEPEEQNPTTGKGESVVEVADCDKRKLDSVRAAIESVRATVARKADTAGASVGDYQMLALPIFVEKKPSLLKSPVESSWIQKPPKSPVNATDLMKASLELDNAEWRTFTFTSEQTLVEVR